MKSESCGCHTVAGLSLSMWALAVGGVLSLTNAEALRSQTPAKDTAAIRAHNSAVVGKEMGAAVAAYLDSRVERRGEDLGVKLCGAKLKTALPNDESSLPELARTVGAGRQVACENLPGGRSAEDGFIRVDSVSMSLVKATVFATVSQYGATHLERVSLETVGPGERRKWAVVDIDTVGTSGVP